jgi:hypothetical protein
LFEARAVVGLCGHIFSSECAVENIIVWKPARLLVCAAENIIVWKPAQILSARLLVCAVENIIVWKPAQILSARFLVCAVTIFPRGSRFSRADTVVDAHRWSRGNTRLDQAMLSRMKFYRYGLSHAQKPGFPVSCQVGLRKPLRTTLKDRAGFDTCLGPSPGSDSAKLNM